MKPRVVTITNQKGGVGKSTSVVNLSAAFAQKGHKVVAVDLDAQSNLTQSFWDEKKHGKVDKTFFTYITKTLKEDLETKRAVADQIIVEAQKNLLLVPANGNFSGFDSQFGMNRTAPLFLKKFIEEVLSPVYDPDFIVIDTPPILGMATMNALVAATEIYVPMETQEYVKAALDKLSETIDEINEGVNMGGKQLEITGYFFTRHNPRTILSKSIKSIIEKKYPGKALNTYIRQNIALQEAPTLFEDVFTYGPESNGAEDYNKLAEEILNNVKK